MSFLFGFVLHVFILFYLFLILLRLFYVFLFDFILHVFIWVFYLRNIFKKKQQQQGRQQKPLQSDETCTAAS